MATRSLPGLSRPRRRTGPDTDPVPVLDAAADAVGAVRDPLTGRSLADLDMLAAVDLDGDTLRVSVRRPAVGTSADPLLREQIEHATRSVIQAGQAIDARVELEPMDQARRADLGRRLRQEHRRPGGMGSTTAIYAIGSGKGGVGKSTLTANLALALARDGRRVGVLDADVWGYSMPQLLGVREAPIALKGMMLPVAAHAIALMSVGFFVDDDQPVVWRGPMLQKALEQFLDDVYWGDLDVLLVDLPPGTGDVPLSILELMPDAAMVVTTTPQAAAEQVAARIGRMARDARMPIAGVVENMSGTACAHCGQTSAAFGSGGGDRLAATLDATLLGRVPLDPALCSAGDAGTPLMVTAPDSPPAREVARIAERLPRVRTSMVGKSLPLFVR